MITHVCNSSVNKNDRLLIFLIKIKHGLTFSAIDVLFNLHRTSVSRIFFQCLEILSIKIKILFFGLVKVQLKKQCHKDLKNYFLIPAV